MPKGPRRTRVFEKDLTPSEIAIPDTKLLHNLGHHLSAYARAGRGPPTQNLNCRGAWCTAVKLYRKSNDQYKALFIAAGFGDFLEIEPVDLPVAYSLALMERWFGETNTLHLPCGEIGPSPVDWTMITGLRFGGKRIEDDTNFTMERALHLLGKPGATKDNKIILRNIIPTKDEVKANPPTDDEKEKVFRRLFLYVVSSCFFNNNRSLISHKLVKYLEKIDEVGTYDWGAMTYSAFLSGMRRKVTAETGAFTAFWQFLPFWAFEYLDISRPAHSQGNVFPRAKRWICPEKASVNDSPHFFGPQFIASRCQLNYVQEFQVTWRPYLDSAEYMSGAMDSTTNLAKKRIPFRSIETWEYYLGERCLRQFGFPCRVPDDPPEMMYGICEGQDDDLWNGISAINLVSQNLEYSSWFAAASVGRILNVNPFLGGVDIAEKVFSQWMAKYQPDMILISESEYNKMLKDRNAFEEECEKLQDELDMILEIAQLKTVIGDASNLPSPILSDEVSFHPGKDQPKAIKLKPAAVKGLVIDGDDECIAIDPPHPPPAEKAPRSCELAVDSTDNKVAYNMVFPHEGDISSQIHGRGMPPGCLRVSVDGSIKPDALLPVPIDGEMEKVHQAVGSHVAWPQDLIIFPTAVKKKKEQSKKGELQRLQTSWNQAEPTENVQEHFELLYRYTTTTMEENKSSLEIPCHVEVFGGDRTIFLLHENLMALFEFERTDQAAISAYMVYLHTMIRENEKLEKFSFFNPGAKFYPDDEIEPYIVKRLREGSVDCIFFWPYNRDEHWILTIIWNGEIYLLNPLPQSIHFPELEKTLMSAMKTFYAVTGRGNKLPKLKNLIGSPKQPGGIECGYVVMRYMKDIIEDKKLSFHTKWMYDSRKCYTKEQLGEVRFEVLNYIQKQLIYLHPLAEDSLNGGV